jgi:hypothetical protein
MGFDHVALVPFCYTFIVLFSIIGFIVTERFQLFAWTQLGLLLLLPFVFLGVRKGWAWFGAYLALVLGSLVYDLLLRAPELPAGVAVASGRLASSVSCATSFPIPSPSACAPARPRSPTASRR